MSALTIRHGSIRSPRPASVWPIGPRRHLRIGTLELGATGPWPPRQNDASVRKKSAASAASAQPHQIPDLTQIQTRSYERFLQYEIPPQKRKDQGIEGVLREIFPIESYDKTLRLEYIRYELGKPRYEPDECRQLRLTYGRPFRVWLRLTKEQPIEEEVYLGDMPIMLGGGEFIINGAERVVVSQLHRSPGVDFVSDIEAGRAQAAQLPHHSRARQLDRAEHVQEGHAHASASTRAASSRP